MFKNTFFPDHLWMTASALKQLLALYFPIIYSWSLSSSEKSLVGKNVHPYISKILQISFTQIRFFIYFDKCLCYPCQLHKVYAVLWAAKPFVPSEIPKHNAFDLIYENFKNLNSISNIFLRKTLFVLTDSVIICTYF